MQVKHIGGTVQAPARLTIKRATPRDISIINNLLQHGDRFVYKPAISRDEFKKNTFYIGYDTEDNPITMVTTRMLKWGYDTPKFSFTKLVVHEDYRQQGYAYELIHTLMEDLRAQGIHEFNVQVHEENVASIALFKKLGFAIIAVDYRHLFMRRTYV